MTQILESNEDAVYVLFSGEINRKSCESLVELMIRCANQEINQVHLLMSTPGGSVREGVKLHNLLQAFPFKLTTHNIGDIDSIGNVLFMAGERRYACSNAKFMFHGVQRSFGEPISELDALRLRWALEAVLADEQRISSIIEQCSRLTGAEIVTFFKEGRRMDASEALNVGIIHEIKEVKIPETSSIINLSFED